MIDKNMSLEDLDFSVRTWRCLKSAGVKSLEDLVGMSADDLMARRGMGLKSLAEVAEKLQSLGLELEGYVPNVYSVSHEDKAEPVTSYGFWSEIRNDFFESGADILPEEGDVLAKVSIDAWKSFDDDGAVIACVMLSKKGDVLVDYRDGVARTDEAAQEAIWEAKDELRDYFTELQFEQEDLNEMKDEKILYFGEGHFVTREAMQEIAVAAAEDFISKVNKPNGKRDSKHTFSYDFGSPWDELDMYAEYMDGGDSDKKRWWTVCSLYTKGEYAEMTAVQSVEGTTDVNDIATNILELVEELNAKIEIDYVQKMKAKLDAHESGLNVDDKLNNARNRAAEQSISKGMDVARENVKD